MKQTRLLPLLAATLAVALSSPAQSTPAPPPAAPSSAQSAGSDVSVAENVPYGKDPALLLDVYQSASRDTALRPAVVLIHGGGWTSLDKSTMHALGEFLARSGYVVFSIDYRLFQDGRNRWPAQLDDAQRAVRWIRSKAPRYGVDPHRIGAFGHSAGAQLAALLGMVDTRDNSDPALASYSSRVQAVVDASGPIDFTTDHDTGGATFFNNFLGATYAQNPQLWRDASPAFHVAKGNAPFLILHGTEDQSVPVAQAQELNDKLKAAGVPVTLSLFNDGHTFRSPEARRRLAIETLEFFNRTLVTPK